MIRNTTRTKKLLVDQVTDDESSSSDDESDDVSIMDVSDYRSSRPRTNIHQRPITSRIIPNPVVTIGDDSSTNNDQPSTSGSSTAPSASSTTTSTANLNGIGARLRRRVPESRSSSSTTTTNTNTNTNNSASNSPRPRHSTSTVVNRQPGPPSPKLARLSNSSSSLFSPRRHHDRSIVLSSDTSPSPTPFHRRRVRVTRPIMDSDDEQRQGAAGPSAFGGGDDGGDSRQGRLRRATARMWSSTEGGIGHRRGGTATDRRTARHQHQLDADEAYARRLQAQFDAQFQAEQQQRRRREAVAMRRQNRAHANSLRPRTPPPRTRDFMELFDDDDDEDGFTYGMLVNLLESEQTHGNEGRRGRARRGSPNGPTTLASVRRYFREAHTDADRFPDINISVLDFETLLELADEIGDAAPSMSTTEINRLPTSVYRQTSTSVEVVDSAIDSSSASSSSGSANYSDETPNCAICMEKFSDGDVQRNLPCFHAFHKTCVDVWLKQKSSCPVCRVDARRTSPPTSP